MNNKTVSVLGSEDATTCHIAVMRHTGSGATSMIHFDGCSTAQGLEAMITIVSNLTQNMSSGRLELHLVGGFLDDQLNSHTVSNKILKALCECQHEIHLVTACITHFNTVYKHHNKPFPAIYGVAVNIETGEIFPATFPDKGPDLALRSARHFTGGKDNIIIYDPHMHELTIGPFDYSGMPNLDFFLSLTNRDIRKFLSTSPDQEPEGFEDNVRTTLKWLNDFPEPLKSVFKNGAPRRYVKDPFGAWIAVE
ncbi:protein N-terminal asparagine amidohydrolase-like isoform X2 [Physella acuta]|uniref:protein N-terminal asparagine amidohydrolase-like isoform X2 n=1 Tax=Physella acuta TaxID=109671 RepID=UPI0027DCB512|nr:protein N-terminal asparagine amidohydrolase-like isoform X2 [Physella acuta]